jgi:hypothetical protein
VSDGGSTGTPAGAPAAPAAGAPNATAPAAPPSWGERDDADLIERFKKSPHGKRKVNGKEETVSSVDDLKKWILDSQRGVGANRIVEETNKKTQDYEKLRKESDSLRAELAKYKQNQQEPDVAQMSENERRYYEEAKAARAERDAEQFKLRQADEERKASEQKVSRERLLGEAREAAKSILSDVDPSRLDLEIPGIISAMRELKEQGLKFGRDYTPEQLKLLVTQHREASVYSHLERLKPDVAATKLAPLLKSLTPEALEAALGEHFVPLAKAISARWLARHGRGGVKKPAAPVASGESKKADPTYSTTTSTPLLLD